jgi:hypothetical protein
MHTEYAIFDDRGVQFGLPAKTWDTREAVDNALEFLGDRRREMERTAVLAQEALDQQPMADREQKREWQEEVMRWDQEKSRVYTVLQREVGSWERCP